MSLNDSSIIFSCAQSLFTSGGSTSSVTQCILKARIAQPAPSSSSEQLIKPAIDDKLYLHTRLLTQMALSMIWMAGGGRPARLIPPRLLCQWVGEPLGNWVPPSHLHLIKPPRLDRARITFVTKSKEAKGAERQALSSDGQWHRIPATSQNREHCSLHTTSSVGVNQPLGSSPTIYFTPTAREHLPCPTVSNLSHTPLPSCQPDVAAACS